MGHDMWLLCVDSPEIAAMWVKSFKGSMDLNLQEYIPSGSDGAVAVIRNMFDNQLGHPKPDALGVGEEHDANAEF
jgi:hypothetical protein